VNLGIVACYVKCNVADRSRLLRRGENSFDRYAKERIDSYGFQHVSPHDIGTYPHPEGIAEVETQKKEFEAVVKRLTRA
jgi:hypothetical protein